MLGIYFSGTGNSKYALEVFLKKLSKPYNICSIEDKKSIELLKESNEIVLSYPIYCSSIPKILSDFLNKNLELFRNKKVFIISTMGLFSGDGSGLVQRRLKRVNATITGGLNIRMPSNICDTKILNKTNDKNANIIRKSETYIDNAIKKINSGKEIRHGLSHISQALGLFSQRLYTRKMTSNYSSKIKINSDTCVKCGKCVIACPMKNLELKDKVYQKNKCTMCYRCLNLCPTKSITLIGKKVVRQYHIYDYIK